MASLLEPALLMGTVIGVMLNLVLPPIVIFLILTLTLIYNAKKVWKQFSERNKIENDMYKKAAIKDAVLRGQENQLRKNKDSYKADKTFEIENNIKLPLVEKKIEKKNIPSIQIADDEKGRRHDILGYDDSLKTTRYY